MRGKKRDIKNRKKKKVKEHKALIIIRHILSERTYMMQPQEWTFKKQEISGKNKQGDSGVGGVL